MDTAALSKSELQRRAMVSLSAQWFAQRGLAAVNLIEVARAVDAPRGSIYHYFPGGRDQLLLEAITLASLSGRRMIEKAAAQAQNLDHFIDLIFRTGYEQIGGSRYSGGCPIGAAVISGEVESTAVQAEFQQAMLSWQEVLTASFSALGVSPLQYATELSRCALIAYEGALICAKGQQDPQMFASAAQMVKVMAASRASWLKTLDTSVFIN